MPSQRQHFRDPATGQMRGQQRALLADEQLTLIRQLWATNATKAEVAEAAGIGMDTLIARLKDQLADLPPRGRGVGGGRRRGDMAELSEEEIRMRAAEVRRSWGPERYGIGEPIPEDDPRQVGRAGRHAIPDDQ